MDNLKLGKNGIPYTESIQEGDLTYDDLVTNACSYFSIGELEASIQFCDQAIMLQPEYPDAYGVKGVSLFRNGDNANALESLKITINKLTKMMQLVIMCKSEDDLREITEFDFSKFPSDYYEDRRHTIFNHLNDSAKHFKKIISEIEGC